MAGEAENTGTPPTEPAGTPAGSAGMEQGHGDGGTPSAEAAQDKQDGAVSVEELMQTVQRLTSEVKDLRKEAATYRTRAREAEQEVGKARTAEERLAALEKDLADQKAKAVQANAKANLMQYVGNDPVRVTAALRVAEGEGLIGEDGSIDGAAFLEQFPIFKPSTTPSSPLQPGGGNPPRQRAEPLSDIKSMTHEQYEEWRRNGGMAKLQRGELSEQ